MSASWLVSCVGLVTCPGLYPLVKETASAAPTLFLEYGPNGWMGWMDGWGEEIASICLSGIKQNWKSFKTGNILFLGTLQRAQTKGTNK